MRLFSPYIIIKYLSEDIQVKDILVISATNGNKRRNLMQNKILYYRSLPSVTFITTCWSRQNDFNLVNHPTLEKQFLFYFRKKRPQTGFEPSTPTMNPELTHALDRSAMALLTYCW